MVIFTVLGLLGVVSYFSIGYELLPKMSKQIITISTTYPGAAPSEVENSVTKKVEDAISSLEKLDNVKSKSFEGLSSVIVEFKSTVDLSEAMQDAQRKVNAITAQLPEDAGAVSPAVFYYLDVTDEGAGYRGYHNLYVKIRDEGSEYEYRVRQGSESYQSFLNGLAGSFSFLKESLNK